MDILLVGNTKSGKTSIQSVVFQKLSPHEAYFLPQTTKVINIPVSNNKHISFNVKDFPGSKKFEAVSEADRELFKKAGAIIYVYDAYVANKDESCAEVRQIIS